MKDWFAFLSDDFKDAWFKAAVIMLPLFIIGFGFGGFYHEELGESGWTLKGTIEFGRMVVHSTAGCLAFWAFMGFIGKLFATACRIFK